MSTATNAQFKLDAERAAERAISRPVILKGDGPEEPVVSPARQLQERLSEQVEGEVKSAEGLRSRFHVGLQFAAYAASLWCVGFVLYSLI